jgi:hypothetical protein
VLSSQPSTGAPHRRSYSRIIKVSVMPAM